MFIDENFMLKNRCSKELYEFVKELPIIDYHCHLDPKMIYDDYKFKNAFELFLGGDHYKWRQMRTHGIDERYITGDASDYEKFSAFAKMMPYLIGNPLYHWTHLELKRYFGIETELDETTCESIWNRCGECLKSDEFSAKSLIRMPIPKVFYYRIFYLSNLTVHFSIFYNILHRCFLFHSQVPI